MDAVLQAGLPARLRTIVDLEALLNDGSAYVLFYLLRVSLPSIALQNWRQLI